MPESEQLSESTKKRIYELPEHAQEIYKEAHANALERYKDPNNRRDSDESPEEVAHKVAWSAVKNEYEKQGDWWVKKERRRFRRRSYTYPSLLFSFLVVSSTAMRTFSSFSCYSFLCLFVC